MTMADHDGAIANLGADARTATLLLGIKGLQEQGTAKVLVSSTATCFTVQCRSCRRTRCRAMR